MGDPPSRRSMGFPIAYRAVQQDGQTAGDQLSGKTRTGQIHSDVVKYVKGVLINSTSAIFIVPYLFQNSWNADKITPLPQIYDAHTAIAQSFLQFGIIGKNCNIHLDCEFQYRIIDISFTINCPASI